MVPLYWWFEAWSLRCPFYNPYRIRKTIELAEGCCNWLTKICKGMESTLGQHDYNTYTFKYRVGCIDCIIVLCNSVCISNTLSDILRGTIFRLLVYNYNVLAKLSKKYYSSILDFPFVSWPLQNKTTSINW